MTKKVVRLTRSLLNLIVKEHPQKVRHKEETLNPDFCNESTESLLEISCINVKENGNVFPHDSWKIKIWSNDQTPAHFHVIKDGWNVCFLIADGSLYEIKNKGSKQKVFNYMCYNIKEWLQSPCAILPQITNQQNAELQWMQLHG